MTVTYTNPFQSNKPNWNGCVCNGRLQVFFYGQENIQLIYVPVQNNKLLT
jgi:hypothetical protein